ncbi:MAG: hypothetical protein ACI8W8_003410 [Rhodothermales bacterium]|jgi:hypothetical protein
MKNRNFYISVSLGLFSFLTIIGLIGHEMWRDEMRVWLTATKSADLSLLFDELIYDGHPGLWYLLVRALSPISQNPEIVKVLHFAVAATTACLILKSECPIWQKCLLPLGYFFVYEYGVISRNYSLGICLLIGAAVLHSRGRYRLSLCCLLPASLASVHALVIALAFHIVLLFKLPKKGWAIFSSGLILFFFYLQFFAFNSRDGRESPEITLSFERIIDYIENVTYAFFPIPSNGINFWNQMVALPPILSVLLFIVIISSIAYYFRSHRTILAFLVAVFCLFLLLNIFFVSQALRHCGHFFVSFVIALIISAARKLDADLLEEVSPRANSKAMDCCIGAVLCLHVILAVFAVKTDVERPFSNAKQTADFIKKNNLAAAPIIVDWHPAGESLAAYLDKELVMYRASHFGYFTPNTQAVAETSAAELMNSAASMAKTHKQDILLILTYNADPLLLSFSSPELRVAKLFESNPKAIVDTEDYYVYLFSPTN